MSVFSWQRFRTAVLHSPELPARDIGLLRSACSLDASRIPAALFSLKRHTSAPFSPVRHVHHMDCIQLSGHNRAEAGRADHVCLQLRARPQSLTVLNSRCYQHESTSGQLSARITHSGWAEHMRAGLVRREGIIGHLRGILCKEKSAWLAGVVHSQIEKRIVVARVGRYCERAAVRVQRSPQWQSHTNEHCDPVGAV